MVFMIDADSIFPLVLDNKRPSSLGWLVYPLAVSPAASCCSFPIDYIPLQMPSPPNGWPGSMFQIVHIFRDSLFPLSGS